MSRWSPALCLIGAALAVGWPAFDARRRLRSLARSGPAALAPIVGRLRMLVQRPAAVPSRLAPLAALGAGGAGLIIAGPVGAVAAAAYGGLAAAVLLRRRAARGSATEHAERLDALCALAADLRAGLPAVSAPPAAAGSAALAGPPAVAGLPALAGPPNPGDGPSRDQDGLLSARRIDRLARAAVLLAEETGAPLADLLDRIAADGRAARRAAATAAAQAAGARATTWLLAGLPVGGIALGYGIDADPLRVLLHTPLGASCAVAAIGLQFAGLAWAGRLTRAPEIG